MSLAESLALWAVGSSSAWLSKRGLIWLTRQIQADPTILTRRMVELGGPPDKPSPRALRAADVVLVQLSAPIDFPAELRSRINRADRSRFDASAAAIPESAWPPLLASLDAGGSPETDRVARAAAQVCGGSDRPEAHEALALRLVERLEEEAERPANKPGAAGTFVLAAARAATPAMVPGLRRALLDNPQAWASRLEPVLARIGTADAVQALAAHWVGQGPKAWAAAHEVRHRAFARHGTEVFVAGREQTCAGARLLAIEASIRKSARDSPTRARILSEALDDPSAFVRGRAVRLLGQTEGDARRSAVRESLRGRLEAGPAAAERRSLVFALVALGDAELLAHQHAYEARDARRSAAERARAEADWKRLGALMSQSKRKRSGEQLGEFLEDLLNQA